MISRWSFNLFGLITVKKYTRSHIVPILINGEIVFAFLIVIIGNYILLLLFFIILFFMLLVFTEIIELNFFGLQKDTKKNIIERAKLQEMRESTDNESNYTEEIDGRESNFSDLSDDINNRETNRESINE